ncbi:MAG TPA: hypothetical protein VMT30_00970 [Candidatus Saccharimonadia bacterium]|nr:hypothetical protein [Candidatus Saccharimonadia bacterium]
MQGQIEAFKNEVRRAAAEPGFVHHAWFAQYHLELVDALRLSCSISIRRRTEIW